MSSLSKLLVALQCPLCDPPRSLRAPITLRCGHTLCVEHVLQPSESPSTNASATPFDIPHSAWSSCPLDSCLHYSQSLFAVDSKSGSYFSKSDASLSDAPTSPKVALLPYRTADFESPNSSDEKVYSGLERLATDVLVSKLLTLVERYRRPLLDLHSLGDPDVEKDLLPIRAAYRGIPPSSITPPESHAVAPQEQDTQDGAALESESREEIMRELTCEICLMLIYKPITTPCQHTFCAKCLSRSLDHNDRCPLCRKDLFGYAYFQGHPVNKLVSALVMDIFPEEYQERGDQVENEGKDARLDTPIFICQLSFPGMPTLLHFFEPRYRLMLRRCLEQENPAFGMIMPAPPGGATDYGTMLEIRSVQMLPDGRSMVETFGAHRFRIVERGTIDGYMVGRVEQIEDVDDELDTEAQTDGLQITDTEPTNEEMISICRTFVEQLRSGMAPWVVQRLNHTYGPMPDDISNFTFWMGLILPLDEHEKAKLLPIRSPRLRLRLLVHWIEQLNSQWWFMNGCTIM